MHDPAGLAVNPVSSTRRHRSSIMTRCVTAGIWCMTALVAVACSAAADQGHNPAAGGSSAPTLTSVPAPSRLVGPREFAAAVAEPGRVTINVHVPDVGDIAGTDVSIPFDQIDVQLQRLPADRSTPLAIYCRTGRMSAIAATALSRLGYSQVVELDGGMEAWQATGGILTPHQP
jgi:phage shock protein E